MDALHLQDLISRGAGIAARQAGQSHDAYRPNGPSNPLSASNRYLRLPALFNNEDPRFTRAAAYARPARYGIFDSAYTRPGDYLVGPGGAYFIAAQEHLLPPLCILTNATVTALRPATAATLGLSAYSGIQKTNTVTILGSWPVSLLATGGGGTPILPADGSAGVWTILLPPMPYDLQTSDIVTDDQSRTFVVATADRTPLGVRLSVKQATT